MNDRAALSLLEQRIGDAESETERVKKQRIEIGGDLENLKKYEFLGSHNNVALGVLGGYYDAGGVKEGVFYKYKGRGLKMLAKSPGIAEHVFVASANLPEATINTLRHRSQRQLIIKMDVGYQRDLASLFDSAQRHSRVLIRDSTTDDFTPGILQ